MRTALITGASSGIGLEFARQLAASGHDLVLVARDVERLEEISEQLNAEYGVQVEVLPADLSDAEGLTRVVTRLRLAESMTIADGLTHNPVNLLVNNAGFGTGQPLVGGDIEAEIRALDVMVKAVLVLSQAAAEQMVAKGRGAIINVGSIAALTAGGSYAAAKAWVRTFTEALAAELKGTGVAATVIAPGLTRTEFHQRGGLETAGFPDFVWLNPAQVVSEGLAAARRGDVHCTPSLLYKGAAATLRLAPRGLIRVLGNSGMRPKPGAK